MSYMLPKWDSGYSVFYLSSWDYFLSGFTDSDSGRSAIKAAARMLTESAEIGRQWRIPTNQQWQ